VGRTRASAEDPCAREGTRAKEPVHARTRGCHQFEHRIGYKDIFEYANISSSLELGLNTEYTNISSSLESGLT
jgi:hypothetical protein